MYKNILKKIKILILNICFLKFGHRNSKKKKTCLCRICPSPLSLPLLSVYASSLDIDVERETRNTEIKYPPF